MLMFLILNNCFLSKVFYADLRLSKDGFSASVESSKHLIKELSGYFQQSMRSKRNYEKSKTSKAESAAKKINSQVF